MRPSLQALLIVIDWDCLLPCIRAFTAGFTPSELASPPLTALPGHKIHKPV